MPSIDNLRTFADDQNNQRLPSEMNNESRTSSRRNSIEDTPMVRNGMTPLARSVSDERLIQINQISDDYMARPPDVFRVNETFPTFNESLTAHVFGANPDEESTGRPRHPSNGRSTTDGDYFSWLNIFLHRSPIFDDIPFGIEDTQAHSMALPIINAPDHRNFHFNHENDYRNAGATVHTEPDGWIDLGTVQIEEDEWMIVDGDMTRATIDDSAD